MGGFGKVLKKIFGGGIAKTGLQGTAAKGLKDIGIDLGGAGGAFSGTKDKMQNIPLYNEQQNSAMDALLKSGFGGLMGLPAGLEMGGGGGGFGGGGMGGFNGLGGESGTETNNLNNILGGLGTAAGSYFGGPIGAGVGGLLGQGAAGLWNYFNKPAEQAQYQPGDYASALQQLGGLPNENQLNFAPIKRNAEANFRERGIPELAKRFGAMGSSGNRRSSSFAQALGSGEQGLRRDLAEMEQGANLQNFTANQAARQAQQMGAMNLLAGNRGYGVTQQQLAQNKQRIGQGQQELNLRQQLGMGGLNQGQQAFNLQNLQNQQQLYQSMLGAGLTPRNQNAFMAGKPGFFENLMTSAAKAIPGAAMGYFAGGPVGAAMGGFKGLNS